MPKDAINLTGRRFGRFLVLGLAPRPPKSRPLWFCLCNCGTLKIVDSSSLKRGKIQSCGCLREDNRRRGETHGCSKLTDAQVVFQRERYFAGGVTYDLIAAEFDLSKHAVAQMLTGKTYSHLPLPPSAFVVTLERCVCGRYKRRGIEHFCPLLATHCKHGHPFDSANTYYDKDGWRHCKRCHRESGHNPLRRARAAGLRAERIIKTRVLEAAKGLCGICGKAVDPSKWHLDHIVPIVKGGSHIYENVQPTHPSCNLAKNNFDMADAVKHQRELTAIDLCEIIWAAGQKKSHSKIAEEFHLTKARIRGLLKSMRQELISGDNSLDALTQDRSIVRNWVQRSLTPTSTAS